MRISLLSNSVFTYFSSSCLCNFASGQDKETVNAPQKNTGYGNESLSFLALAVVASPMVEFYWLRYWRSLDNGYYCDDLVTNAVHKYQFPNGSDYCTAYGSVTIILLLYTEEFYQFMDAMEGSGYLLLRLPDGYRWNITTTTGQQNSQGSRLVAGGPDADRVREGVTWPMEYTDDKTKQRKRDRDTANHGSS